MRTQVERFTLLIATLALSGTVIAQQETIGDRKYELSVVTADAGDFRDCANFREDHSLQLEASNGLVITWLPAAGDRTGTRFHAVTSAANAYGLALHGTFADRSTISGNAVNDRGRTFTFTGRLNPDCWLRAAGHFPGGPHLPASTSDPYSAAPLNPELYERSDRSVAGRLYDVRLYGGDSRQDCYQFAINGVLARNGGANLTWRMDDLNTAEDTFQAVGSPAFGTGGVAAFGQRMPWGELRVHGFDNQEWGLRLFVGSGQETGSCIDD